MHVYTLGVRVESVKQARKSVSVIKTVTNSTLPGYYDFMTIMTDPTKKKTYHKIVRFYIRSSCMI